MQEEGCVQDCTIDDFVTKLQEDTPNVNGCSAESIANVDLSALYDLSVTAAQLATVFTFTRLEDSLTNNVFNQSIDVIYETLTQRDLTPPFISVCYRSTFMEEITGTFDLSNMLISSFKRVDLLDLTNLISLDLSDNELSNLSDGIFDDLTSLIMLDLSDNALSMLPDGIFDTLTMLISLIQDCNALSNLPDGIFDDLTGLITLDLSDNELSNLPDGIFDDLTSLIMLDLGDNALSMLPDGIFDTLTMLISLIQDCNFEDFVTRLQEDMPNVNGCSTSSIETARTHATYLDDFIERDFIPIQLSQIFNPSDLIDNFSIEELARAFTFMELEDSLVDLTALSSDVNSMMFLDNVNLIYNISIMTEDPAPFVSVCYRTTQVRDEIIEVIEDLLEAQLPMDMTMGISLTCGEITTEDLLLPENTPLSFPFAVILSIKRVDFLGLSNLAGLSFQNNPNLSDFPGDTLTPLTNLIVLNLQNTSLTCNTQNYQRWGLSSELDTANPNLLTCP